MQVHLLSGPAAAAAPMGELTLVVASEDAGPKVFATVHGAKVARMVDQVLGSDDKASETMHITHVGVGGQRLQVEALVSLVCYWIVS